MKKRKSLDMAALTSAALPQPDPVRLAVAPQAGSEARSKNGQVSRANKVQIQGYFPESTRRELKALAATQGRTVEDLLAEAIADLLAKHK